jgi:hypothetical protein
MLLRMVLMVLKVSRIISPAASTVGHTEVMITTRLAGLSGGIGATSDMVAL